MNAVTIPGFNAEASIYKSVTYYQTAMGLNRNDGISLQQADDWSCDRCLQSGVRYCCGGTPFRCYWVPCDPNDPCADCRTPRDCCECSGGIWQNGHCF
jgi:hypothetical protein